MIVIQKRQVTLLLKSFSFLSRALALYKHASSKLLPTSLLPAVTFLWLDQVRRHPALYEQSHPVLSARAPLT